MIIVFDTETTGLPDWGKPSGAAHQPHLVEIAAVLCSDDLDVLREYSAIVRPDGWEIPTEVSDIHGITTDKAHAEGVAEDEAVRMFMDIHDSSDMRVGHNISFDDRIMRIALKRYLGDEVADKYKQGRKTCTMWESLKLCRVPPTKRMCNKGMNGYKKPSLAEAYKHFTGEELEGAHRAMVDVRATLRVLQGIRDAEVSHAEPA